MSFTIYLSAETPVDRRIRKLIVF